MAYKDTDEMAQSTNVASGEVHAATDGPVLRTQLAVEPHPESGCVVASVGEEAREITQHHKTAAATGETENGCGECHTEVSFGAESDRDRSYLKSAVSQHCICPVLSEHDCIPQIQGIRSGSIIVTLTIPRREVLPEIIRDLKRVAASVSVDWLVNDTVGSETTEIDVSSVTTKQQEAMETAMEMGYYESPRRADLGDLATKLDISESAASQRLNAAETKLVRAFLEE